jgi:hypothetical protein
VKKDTEILGDNAHGQGKRRISLLENDVVTLLSVELEALVIERYTPPIEHRETRMVLKEKEVLLIPKHQTLTLNPKP